MWTLVGIGGLVIGALVVLLWDFSRTDDEQIAETRPDEGSSGQFSAGGKALTNNSAHLLSYTLTRWDLAASWLGFCFRHRMFHGVVLLGLLILESLILNDIRPDSFAALFVAAGSILLAFFVPLTVAIVIAMLAMAYLFKHPGVIGLHTLQITERGLLECTEFNETLIKWPAIRRLRSTGRYLFISVTDFQAQVVPKRCVAREQLKEFEAELRARMKMSGAAKGGIDLKQKAEAAASMA